MTEQKITRRAIEEAFEAAVKKDNLCNLGKIIAESEHGSVIEEKVKDDLNYSGATISRVLKGLGFPPVSTEMVNKHRKGACRCR